MFRLRLEQLEKDQKKKKEINNKLLTISIEAMEEVSRLVVEQMMKNKIIRSMSKEAKEGLIRDNAYGLIIAIRNNK